MDKSLTGLPHAELQSLAIVEFAQKARYGGWLYLMGAVGCVLVTPSLSLNQMSVLLYLTAFTLVALCREVAFRLVMRSIDAAQKYFVLYVLAFLGIAVLWTSFSLQLMYVMTELRGSVAVIVAATAGFTASSAVVLVPHFRLIVIFITIMLFVPILAIPVLLNGDERWLLVLLYALFYVFLLGMGKAQSASYWQHFAMTDALKRQAAELNKAREEALAGSKAKSAFLANMSHEIRTPMNGVMGMLQLLESTETSEEQKRYLRVLHQSSDTLLKIIDDILEFSRLEADKLSLQPEPVDINSMFKELWIQFKEQLRERPVQLRLDASGFDDYLLMLDPVRLRQVLYNLVGNALKFTHTGYIEVEAKLLTATGEDYASADDQSTAPALKITITDTGEGIPEADIERIFQEFHQVDSLHQINGTGLGLAISNRLIQKMGGELRVSSEVGRGSSFWFEIPHIQMVEHREGRDDEPLSSEQVKLDLEVLVAEDNPVNRSVIKGLLTHLGCRVTLSNNGLEALEMVRFRSFDVILMDCDMPVMDGFEATEEIRLWEQHEQRTPTPIVALTAHVLESARQLCWEAGMDSYLAKPVTLPQLVETLQPWVKTDNKELPGTS